MTETDLDHFLNLFFSAGDAEGTDVPRKHREQTGSCPPLMTLLNGLRTGLAEWSNEARVHIRSCSFCQRNSERLWQAECFQPNEKVFSLYDANLLPADYAEHLRCHVEESGCPRCTLLLKDARGRSQDSEIRPVFNVDLGAEGISNVGREGATLPTEPQDWLRSSGPLANIWSGLADSGRWILGSLQLSRALTHATAEIPEDNVHAHSPMLTYESSAEGGERYVYVTSKQPGRVRLAIESGEAGQKPIVIEQALELVTDSPLVRYPYRADIALGNDSALFRMFRGKYSVLTAYEATRK